MINDVPTDHMQVLAIVVQEKGLQLGCKPKTIMFIEDIAEFAQVLLTTTDITFPCDWL